MRDGDAGAREPQQEVHEDTPVSRDGDLLGRRPFAQLIAGQIRRNRPSDGLVTAVVGDWGSGKTSVLRMVAEELEDPTGAAVAPGAPQTVIVEFNPWLFSGSDQLTALFFVSLAQQLPEKLGSGRADVVAERLRTYGRALGTLRSVPGIGNLIGVGVDVAQEAADRLSPQAPDLPSQRRALSEALRRLDLHVVVLVDDVDRLQSETEIRDLMRMVKLVGDLPGVTYVLAYDRRPVAAALSYLGISGDEYLEKIVQIEHRLPEPPRERLVQMLGHELDGVLADTLQERLDGERWPQVYERIIQPLVQTPRHVRRYVNALRLTLDLHRDEVDLVDQLALTAVSTFVSRFHLRLPGLADVLLPNGSYLSAVFPEEGREEAKTTLESAANESGRHDVILAVYELLFPRTNRILHRAEASGFNEREAQRRRRVADPEAFWTYLTAAVPDEGLTMARVNAVLEAIGDEDRLLAELRDRELDDLGRLFDRLRAHVRDIDPASVPSAARLIATHLRERTAKRVQTIDDPRRAIVWFVVDLVSRIPDDERHSFLTTWASDEPSAEGKLAVYEIARYETDNREPLVGRENLIELERDLAGAVQGTPVDQLLNLAVSGRLLYLAGRYLEANDLPSLHKLLGDDRLFVRYLLVFTEPALFQGPRPIQWKELTDVLGADWLVARLATVAMDVELDEELAEVLDTARVRAAAEGAVSAEREGA